ncbi:hypothetical protein [Burkholderia lata]|uniref:hypothetical protein n=1 Tax=Burkholderia lata (strain ATCC 17760 / DSM 23089 / LMG 22485 / NCIMB 9086 / R18194 / 383) TaxID=482957 RepID=UPI00158260F5|nr:hypothetical protein [Burkholderia lata]
MATSIVSYPAVEGVSFDREQYLATHAALVRAAWGEFGLQSVEVLFPVSGLRPFGCGTVPPFLSHPGMTSRPRSIRAATDAALNLRARRTGRAAIELGSVPGAELRFQHELEQLPKRAVRRVVGVAARCVHTKPAQP